MMFIDVVYIARRISRNMRLIKIEKHFFPVEMRKTVHPNALLSLERWMKIYLKKFILGFLSR